MNIWMVVMSIISLILIVFMVISWKLSEMLIHPKKVTILKAKEIEIKCGKLVEEIYNSYVNDEFKLKSEYGYDLDCVLIYREGIDKNIINQVNEKFIIICHGFEFNKIGSVKYIDIFRKRGFNVLLYDHRNCGESGGDSTTMGYLEKNDLKLMIDYIKHNFGESSIVGIHGESMGASTALLTLEISNEISFIIADCGYSNLKELLAYQLQKRYKLPKTIFVYGASFVTMIRVGFKFSNIMPVDVVKNFNKKVPILFIHGENDNFTPAYMSEVMYKARKNSTEKNVVTSIYIAQNADHAESYWNNKEKYDSKVGEFLNKVINVNGDI